MDQFANAAAAIQASVDKNNAWSAQQAQKQMDFQREMSNTAFQRQMADMKAAGLNPVLSAKLGGASTPSGAMASGDTSGTSALVDLLQLAMETANTASVAAARSAGSGGRSGSGSSVEDNAAPNLMDIFAKSSDENGKPKPDYEKQEEGMRKAADMLWTDRPRTIGQYVGNVFSELINWTIGLAEESRNSGIAPPDGTSAKKAYDSWHPTENRGQSKRGILDSFFGDKIVAKSSSSNGRSSHTSGKFDYSGSHTSGKF